MIFFCKRPTCQHFSVRNSKYIENPTINDIALYIIHQMHFGTMEIKIKWSNLINYIFHDLHKDAYLKNPCKILFYSYHISLYNIFDITIILC